MEARPVSNMRDMYHDLHLGATCFCRLSITSQPLVSSSGDCLRVEHVQSAMSPWGTIDRMAWPMMEDAVPGWYSTVFKRCAMHAIVQTRLCLERVRLSLCTDAPLNKSRMVVELR